MHGKFALAKVQGVQPPGSAQSSASAPPMQDRSSSSRVPVDEMNDELPPPYTPGPGRPPLQSQQQQQASYSGSPSQPPPSSTLPQYSQQQPTTPKVGNLYQCGTLGIYHTSYSDLYISHSNTTTPILYIGTHGVFSHQADITLHSTCGSPGPPLATSPTIGTADFETLSNDFHIQLFDPDGSGVQTGGVTVSKHGWLNATWEFSLLLPDLGQRVTFTWRESRSAAVGSLQGRNQGWECVTGEDRSVAAFTGPEGVSVKKLGKMAFFSMRYGEGWGDGVEAMVLVSLMGILERERRGRNHRRHRANRLP